MKLSTYVRWMLRDSRGARGRMVYFTICLAVGVAAVVGTAALADGLDRGFDLESRAILGADLTIDAKRPLPAELDEALARVEGLERTDSIEAMSMVLVPGVQSRSRLARIFAVRGSYPLYGEIVTDPAGGLSAHLAPDTVVVEQDLLSTLGIAVGDTVRVGTQELRVAATATGGPQQTGFTSFLAPRLYLSNAAFQRTGLLGFGSRVQYRALVRLPGPPSRETIDGLVERLEATVPDAAYLDFDPHHQIGRGRRWIQRMEGFVGLAALLSLVIGGIGVALIVRAWIAGRTRAMAVMRALGVTPKQILVLSLGHTLLLALAGSLVGAVLGCLLPLAVRTWAPSLLPVEIVSVIPVGAVLRGVGLGVGLSLAFALPALSAIWRVSPARVLRSDADPLPPHRLVQWASGAFLVAAVFAAAWVQADQTKHAVWFTGGFVVLIGVLYLAARALLAFARRIPRRRLSPYLVHGITALARPGAGTVGAVVALGLGTMVITAIGLVETRLRDAILANLPRTAPSVFLLDINPAQRDAVRAELADVGADEIDEVPVVMARIASIDGKSVAEISQEEGRGGWSLTREQRLTWREELTPDNEITAGALWSDPERKELSIEAGFAKRLGVDVGSRIEFDVQGVPITLHVTSLRTVEWQSLSLNFFLVAEPGALQGAPALYLTSARVPPAQEQVLQDGLAAAVPNVTVLRVRAVLDQIMALLERIALGLRILGAFTVLAGLAILAGSVSASVLHRRREVALLKTLGVTRGGVLRLFLTEYGLCGALAGLVGGGGALLLAWTWLEHIAEIEVSLPWLAMPIAMGATAVLTAVCGLAANFRAFRARPREVLR